ncbi:hypothetical protein [Gallaecimonas sp. GXIMD4217]|uniref:hypothetical protein n=1 Tax=Gallaecimonas sp. GXIMD4217 TaxID=3131927 RepID=UPI00311B1DF3
MIRIGAQPYQPTPQEPRPALQPQGAEAAAPKQELVRYSVPGLAAAEGFRTQYDQPPGRNLRAIAQYRSLELEDKREQARSLLGVDLFV